METGPLDYGGTTYHTNLGKRLLIGLSFTVSPHLVKNGASEPTTTKTGWRGRICPCH